MTDPLNHEAFFAATAGSALAAWHPALRQALAHQGPPHGKEAEWQQALARLKRPPTSDFDLAADCVRIGTEGVVDRELLKRFCPWRKGPFCYFGVRIDAEWRSDWKWRRIEPHISPLAGRAILDVGCGNGYYLLRMLGAGARLALGIDPSRLCNYQFRVINQNAALQGAHLLPLGAEQLPALGCMDTVFSLGVLYHRRSPVDHLKQLHGFLRPGGELVLETLVIPGDASQALRPRGRYAKMPNVHFIPSVACLEALVAQQGFASPRTVDITRTTPAEQRPTEWMPSHSLQHFLDPKSPARTIEGHPAPTRATLIATKPK